MEPTAAPVQEPVGYIDHADGEIVWKRKPPLGSVIYTTPPAAPAQEFHDDLTIAYMAGYSKGKAAAQPALKPLTDEQIHALWRNHQNRTNIVDVVRAIEAAHGIKGDA